MPNTKTPRFFSQVYRRLKNHFGEIPPPLDYKTNEQLAVAVILSAQCTDERVNIVTKDLFKEAPDMKALNKMSLKRLKELIYSTGFYNAKAKNIKSLANILMNDYQGKIPNDFKTLVNLPGIGRKTANVIMNQAFDAAEGIVVDTHVRRITQRLGLTLKKTPEQIEKDLMSYVPKKYWKDMSIYIIFHGRKFCECCKFKQNLRNYFLANSSVYDVKSYSDKMLSVPNNRKIPASSEVF